MQVEVGVLDPVREVEPERDLGELPAERRQRGEPFLEQRVDVTRVQRAAGPRRRVEDREAAYVACLPRRLECQELGVEARELSHLRGVFHLADAAAVQLRRARVRRSGTPTEEDP